MTDPSIHFRTAGATDAPAAAAFHVKVWRATYAGLAPDAALRQLDHDRRLPQWQARLADQGGDALVIVAERGAEVIGLMAVGAAVDPVFGGRLEVKHLYVDATVRRQRVGARLLHHAAAHAVARGRSGLALAVVAANGGALDFYRRLGGVVAGGFIDPGPLWRSSNLIVVWDDLPTLLAATAVAE